MNKVNNLIVVFIIALALQACAIPVNNIPSHYTLNNKNGVVVFSLTASGDCNFIYFVDIRNSITRSSDSVGLKNTFGGQDWYPKSNTCPTNSNDYGGRLIVMELPEGTYDIYNLTGINTKIQITSDSEMVMRFHVKNNQIKYLGNVHFHVGKKDSTTKY